MIFVPIFLLIAALGAGYFYLFKQQKDILSAILDFATASDERQKNAEDRFTKMENRIRNVREDLRMATGDGSKPITLTMHINAKATENDLHILQEKLKDAEEEWTQWLENRNSDRWIDDEWRKFGRNLGL